MENVPTWEENLNNTLAYDLLYLVKKVRGNDIMELKR